MDTVGAVLGPVLAMVLMVLLVGNFKQVLWFAVLPAFVAVLLIVVGIEEPKDESSRHRFRSPIRRDVIRQFSGDYWRVVVMSLAYTFSAYPAGMLSDRVNRRSLLAIGLLLLILTDLVLAWAGSPLIVALWGLHMGFTQCIFAAMIADVTPQEWRGTAFGLLNLASGIFVLLASLIAGGLWDRFGTVIILYRSRVIAGRPYNARRASPEA